MFVDSLISNLGLAKVQDSLVGDVAKRGVFGVERKRLNVALELAAAPSVLVLDRPTSGLDATTALSLIELLKGLSQQGVTIIYAVHQPRKEMFTALNDLLLLEAGKQVFFGQAQDAMVRLQGIKHDGVNNCNPADVVLDIISGVDGCSLQPGLESDLIVNSFTANALQRIRVWTLSKCIFPREDIMHHPPNIAIINAFQSILHGSNNPDDIAQGSSRSQLPIVLL